MSGASSVAGRARVSIRINAQPFGVCLCDRTQWIRKGQANTEECVRAFGRGHNLNHASRGNRLAVQLAEDEKLDALEDNPPPELTVGDWINAGNVGLTLEELRGKVVLIDFWSTQRKGGLGIISKLEQLHDKYQTKGLVIVGIHATAGADAMSDFVARQKLPWAIAADVENATSGAWHISSYPSYFLIDRSGKLRFVRIYRADLERAIKQLLTEK